MDTPAPSAPVVTVEPVGDESRDLVERLGQFERHDMSEFRGGVPGEDGTFPFPRLPLFFDEPEREVLLIRADGAVAGFALTRPLPDGSTSIGAFFILRGLRRGRVGLRAALALLRLRPGRWSIAFQEDNPGAARFWRRVADAAAGDAWREERREVPGRPELPPDTWILLDTGDGRPAS
ncbi:GNAT family N-acetyltransferase [Nocardiopsis sp. RSe5-2]|uniref:GNAT family N-acetyltransferase n=1 Tax=Nocardiopsis endophytica TaxID=3018445 RepID=A0ABT4UDS7_9ACTN|nr:GNAT family N-acetyltransferase [Nocardiopsis endophytica]MDA2815126.1 GNAT family N-acetyltransferase [Nocardiopsis endophytica]